MRIDGVGSEYADLLEAAGVDSPAELAHRNAANLATTFQEIDAARPNWIRRVPSETTVTGWIEQAKAHGQGRVARRRDAGTHVGRRRGPRRRRRARPRPRHTSTTTGTGMSTLPHLPQPRLRRRNRPPLRRSPLPLRRRRSRPRRPPAAPAKPGLWARIKGMFGGG